MGQLSGMLSYGWGATKAAATTGTSFVSEKIEGTQLQAALSTAGEYVAPIAETTKTYAVSAKDTVVEASSDIMEKGTEADSIQGAK
jgi:hypothetical protein